jgi:hypothetical protein
MKTINATLTVTRDGVSKSTNLKNIEYGKLVTVEASLAAAQQQFIVWGIGQLANLPGFASNANSASKSDFSVRLVADFGKGSAEFYSAWSGLTEDQAHQMAAVVDASLGNALA